MSAPPGASRYDLDRSSLAELLAGEPRYRVDQLWTGLYERLADPTELTDLPGPLREVLEQLLTPALEEASSRASPTGDTCKWLWRLADGHHVETVLMHYSARSTVCVSTQAGCAMACGFCATGQAGFDRNLTTGEIVEQVVRAARASRRAGRRLSNVVFMGMGEPLANFDRTWAAIERCHGALGLSARHLTLSTVGVVPGILRLADQPLPVSLAVSLHAADDAKRDRLVPINRRYPLGELVAACQAWRRARGRRLSLEWAMISGVNDGDGDARDLAGIARELGAHVNLIPLNPTPAFGTPGSAPDRVREFHALLGRLGVNATVRRNRGVEIDAACGQLRARARPPVPVTVAQPWHDRPRGPTVGGAARMGR